MVTLASAFASRSMIVVLDNCEHLVDDVADFVTEITKRPITTHLVTTSREALGVPEQGPPGGVDGRRRCRPAVRQSG